MVSPSQVGVPALGAEEILAFRNYLEQKAEQEKEAKRKANSFASKLVALYEEHKILSVAIQFVITVGVAFVLGYYSLKGQVDDAKNQASELSSQLHTQQSEVNAVQLNVGALQGPVDDIARQFASLDVAGLQANISSAKVRQVNIITTLATASNNIAALGQDGQLQTLQKLNTTRPHMRLGGVTAAGQSAPASISYACSVTVTAAMFESLTLGDAPRGAIHSNGLDVVIDQSGVYHIGTTWPALTPSTYGQDTANGIYGIAHGWIACDSVSGHIAPIYVNFGSSRAAYYTTSEDRFLTAGTTCNVQMCYGTISPNAANPFSFWVTQVA